jgi:hypothetical protein
MKAVQKNLIATFVGSAALSLLLASCGSGGGYNGPKNQPGVNPPMNPPTGTYGQTSHK